MVFTRLPCMIDNTYVVKLGKLLNQNLMIQAIKSNERYFRLTVLKSQMKRFVASVVCFISFLAVYTCMYTQLVPKLYTFSVCSV